MNDHTRNGSDALEAEVETLETIKQLAECEGTKNANRYLLAGWKLLSLNHHRGTYPQYIFGWAGDEPVKQPEIACRNT